MFKISTFKAQGFTLVELMVVLVILGLSVSLIGPNIFNAIDRQPGLIEKELVLKHVTHASVLAFSKGKELEIIFDGRHYKIMQGQQLVKSFNTEKLFFKKQSVTVTINGFVSVPSVSYVFQGREELMEFDLPAFSDQVVAGN